MQNMLSEGGKKKIRLQIFLSEHRKKKSPKFNFCLCLTCMQNLVIFEVSVAQNQVLKKKRKTVHFGRPLKTVGGSEFYFPRVVVKISSVKHSDPTWSRGSGSLRLMQISSLAFTKSRFRLIKPFGLCPSSESAVFLWGTLVLVSVGVATEQMSIFFFAVKIILTNYNKQTKNNLSNPLLGLTFACILSPRPCLKYSFLTQPCDAGHARPDILKAGIIITLLGPQAGAGLCVAVDNRSLSSRWNFQKDDWGELAAKVGVGPLPS